jgi:hypothetical protein
MDHDFSWPVELLHRKGAPFNLEGIDVFYDFNWSSHFKDGRMQFRNGKCLAGQVLRECPADRTPALLLTCRDDERERSFSSDTFFVLVINFPRYLEQADANAAVSYLASRFGPGVTNLSQFSDIAVQSPEEVEAFLEQQLTTERIADWIGDKEDRIADLRTIVGANGERTPPSPGAALEALSALETLDSEIISGLLNLLGKCVDRTARVEALEALTESPAGRRDAGEIMGRRASERLDDARAAVANYQELLETPDSNETTFQGFIEENLWLLGLDYVQLRAGQEVPRGSLDFILERFDGFHDLLELKSPQDPVIEAPETTGRPPSASQYSLSPALANALAQVHVYRETLTEDAALLDRQYGLPQSRDPIVVIVIGRSEVLPPHKANVLRELNKSLHRVEVVPYDVLGRRATAILDAVGQIWVTGPEIPSSVS